MIQHREILNHKRKKKTSQGEETSKTVSTDQVCTLSSCFGGNTVVWWIVLWPHNENVPGLIPSFCVAVLLAGFWVFCVFSVFPTGQKHTYWLIGDFN